MKHTDEKPFLCDLCDQSFRLVYKVISNNMVTRNTLIFVKNKSAHNKIKHVTGKSSCSVVIRTFTTIPTMWRSLRKRRRTLATSASVCSHTRVIWSATWLSTTQTLVITSAPSPSRSAGNGRSSLSKRSLWGWVYLYVMLCDDRLNGERVYFSATWQL